MADHHRDYYSNNMGGCGGGGGGGGADLRSKNDDPPNSRLFVICHKSLEEDELRRAFEKFGKIEDIWVVKDRNTGENKGVTYIKFSKTSEAAIALEEMNGKMLGNVGRPIKVMIASNRDQGSVRETNEEERWVRLFCVLPKSMTENELQQEFQKFGAIEYVTVVKDRATNESKGFGYVKFKKVSSAAKAFEECDKKYKAVFAEPKRPKNESEPKYTNGNSMNYDNSNSNYGNNYNKHSIGMEIGANHPNPEGYTKLQVIVHPAVNQDQLWRLFDIAPGLDYCHYKTENRYRVARGQATVVYSNPAAAAYAREKLHGLEYPLGHRLIVKPDLSGGVKLKHALPNNNIPSQGGVTAPDLARIAETIAQATSLIQAAGFTAPTLDHTICKLPQPQPMANIDAEVAKRCFIVCGPPVPPIYAMKDAFCRFGNLIDVYMLPGKNCGYAKYASVDSANKAIETLHGQEICGSRLKVLEAEERNVNDDRRKRLRTMDDGDEQ
ncbi:RNA-binding protein 45 isoform X1 [Trichogramma pretiosum]|uniref:RNA-binding protein 45 isoform X1 n=1 Tax=Trichogramma pretiosum TaxID=7493 RepID=UPI0006C9BB82|nr:RNA-binding protein 45 isoform X1 [Trichogramma pretiosum]